MNKERIAVATLLLVLLCVPSALLAQTQTGTVTGVLLDPAEAAVPGATITLKNTQTNVERQVTTSDLGVFLFDKVWPGTYSITASKEGFRKLLVDKIEVMVGKSSDVGTLKLEVGAVAETVQVEAGAVPLLETQSAQIAGAYSSKQVISLRAGMGGLDNMALLTPGVVPGFGNVNSNGVQVAANGQRSRSTQFMLDGHQMNDITIGGPSFFVNNLDMIAEYQVVTNQFSAEFGRNLGATVNIITKSGSNSHHGGVTWSHQNSALESKTSLQSRNNLKKPNLINNTWAVNLGGPVVHNKLFYYFGYRGRKQPGSATSIGTASVRALTPAGVNTLLARFPNSKPLQIYKAAGPFAITDGNPTCVEATRTTLTLAGVTGVEACGIARNVPQNTKEWEYDAKVDYTGKRHSLFGRYMVQNRDFCCSGGQSGYWIAVPFRNDSLGITHTFQITPRQINYFKFAYGRFLVAFEGGNTQPISNVRANLTNISLPAGFLDFGLATNLPQNRLLNTFQYQDNWSMNVGRHFLKAGIEFQRNRTSLFFLPFINGSFSFDSSTLTDFVNNTPKTVSFAAGNGTFEPFETDQFYYFQDDIRIAQNFTLNLGIRYENNGQPINGAVDEVLAREKDPAKAFWLQSLPLDQRTIRRQPNDNNNWAPRIGFAYTPRFARWLFGDGRTVFRGGYGIAYELAFYNILLNMTTAAPRVFLFSLDRVPPPGSPFPPAPGIPGSGIGTDVAGAIPVPRNTIDPRTLSQTILSPNFHNPYSQNWSFGFQREVSRSQVMEVRYVGTNSVGNFQSVNINPLFTRLTSDFRQFIPTGATPCILPGSIGPGRADCNRAETRERLNGAFSNYHSLQARYDFRNWKNQFTGGASYTWSKGIDNVSEVFSFFGGGSVAFSQNPFNFTSGERGVSNQNLAHTLVLHYIWELPWFRSQQGFLGRVLGGWQINGVTSFYTGRPYTPVQRTGNQYCSEDGTFDATFAGLLSTCRPFLANPQAPLFIASGNTGTPNVGFVDTAGVIHRGSLSGPVVTQNDVRFLFNNDNAIRFFTHTPFGVGRNNLRGDGVNNWDISIDKRVRVTERIRVHYRMAMIDAFNHRNFDVPTARVDLATFGDPRQNNVGPADSPAGGRSIRMTLWVEF